MTMNDNDVTPETTKPSWGARFQTAREALHLSEKDAATRLHLKPHIIGIIENENFQDGPPAIFMRGYIRSYGRLLNFSEKEITQALAQLDLGDPAKAAFTPQPRIESRNHNNSHVGWSTAFVVLGLTALVGMWWWNAHNGHSPATTDAANTATLPDAAPSPQQNALNGTANPDNNAALNSTPNNIVNGTPNALNNTTVPPVGTSTPDTTDTNKAPTVTATNNPTAAPVSPPTTTPTLAPTPNTTTNTSPTATATTATATTPTSTTDATTQAPTPAVGTDTTAKSAIGEPQLPSLEEDEADATPAQKHHRTKTPDIEQMSVPEEGLDDEPN